MTLADIRAFFKRYERLFNRALNGDLDQEGTAALYADAFIAASPLGVATGRNDDQFLAMMAQGYERYRAMGTRAMRLRDVRLSPIDDHHALAHIGWTATYARPDLPDVAIDFEVHYFIQALDGAPKVFGWAAGDEQALLRQYGVI